MLYQVNFSFILVYCEKKWGIGISSHQIYYNWESAIIQQIAI